MSPPNSKGQQNSNNLDLPQNPVQILDVWIFGKTWCRGWLVTDVWISTASILNLCAISVDRYVAVTRPVKYRSIMTPRRARTIVAGVWSVSFLICFPPLLPQWNPSLSMAPSSPPPPQQPAQLPALGSSAAAAAAAGHQPPPAAADQLLAAKSRSRRQIGAHESGGGGPTRGWRQSAAGEWPRRPISGGAPAVGASLAGRVSSSGKVGPNSEGDLKRPVDPEWLRGEAPTSEPVETTGKCGRWRRLRQIDCWLELVARCALMVGGARAPSAFATH